MTKPTSAESQTQSTVGFRPYVAAEDHARANFYALLARLFAGAPDRALLNAIAQAPPLSTEDDRAELPRAWSRLIAASSVIDEGSAREEFDQLFGGVGRAAVNLHASHHLTGFMMEKPLAELRDTLRELNIARLDHQSFVEDHVSAIFETMRLLIVGGDDTNVRPPAAIAVQQKFFSKYLTNWLENLTTSISKQPLANYYSVVAELTRAFLNVEQAGFEI